MNERTSDASKSGRPRSIPPEAFGLVFRLYSEGLGYRAIADHLAEIGACCATKSSVERCIKGVPPYTGRRVVNDPWWGHQGRHRQTPNQIFAGAAAYVVIR